MIYVHTSNYQEFISIRNVGIYHRNDKFSQNSIRLESLEKHDSIESVSCNAVLMQNSCTPMLITIEHVANAHTLVRCGTRPIDLIQCEITREYVSAVQNAEYQLIIVSKPKEGNRGGTIFKTLPPKYRRASTTRSTGQTFTFVLRDAFICPVVHVQFY